MRNRWVQRGLAAGILPLMAGLCACAEVREQPAETRSRGTQTTTATAPAQTNPEEQALYDGPVGKLSQEKEKPITEFYADETFVLYKLEPRGVILVHNKTATYFDWEADSFRSVSRTAHKPVQMLDIDGDGQQEIAIILNVNHGTGCWLEDLHVLKQSETGDYTEYTLPADKVHEWLGGSINAGLAANKKDIIITAFGQTHTAKGAWYPEVEFDRVYYEDVIEYTAEQGKIKVKIGVRGDIKFIGEITAMVTLKNNKLGLEKQAFNLYDDFK